MPIVGVTTNEDGSARIHRTVTCKVAIGLPPDSNANYPKKLDHLVFLKQIMEDKTMKWKIDTEKQDHFGAGCKECWVVFLDNDIDTVFRTELAAYVKTKCWCRGDGERAERRKQVEKEWPPKGDFAIFKGPCANHGCPDFEPQGDKPAACKPSADLYFMLADYPTLGTICRIHTSSYQSIRQIHSALMDLQAVTGGRLMGVRAKLFVMPAKSVFTQKGVEKTGTKFVLGLELAAKDMPELMLQMSNTAVMFQGLQKQLAGHVLEIEEDDEPRAAEITAEFYVDGTATQEEDTEEKLREQADKLIQEARPGWNMAKRQGEIAKYKGRMQELIDKITTAMKGESCPATSPKTQTDKSPESSAAEAHVAASSADDPQPSSATTQPATDAAAPATRRYVRPARSTAEATQTSAQSTKDEANTHGMLITDDDFDFSGIPGGDDAQEIQASSSASAEAVVETKLGGTAGVDNKQAVESNPVVVKGDKANGKSRFTF